jgi:hypothetical protein
MFGLSVVPTRCAYLIAWLFLMLFAGRPGRFSMLGSAERFVFPASLEPEKEDHYGYQKAHRHPERNENHLAVKILVRIHSFALLFELFATHLTPGPSQPASNVS